jgi:hypothetical protein
VDGTPATVAADPLVPVRYRIEFTASERYVELLEEARDLLQHQIPDRDVTRVHELAMAAFVEQLRKRRQAASSRPRPPRSAKGSAPERVESPEVATERSAPERVDGAEIAPERVDSRYVPADVRRAVWLRDEGRCTFEDSSGRRCSERAGLELHHEHAFALGGPTTTENLRLLCRSHNGLLAERDFGRAHMRGILERARVERLGGPAG